MVAVLGGSADAVSAGLPRQWPGGEIRLVSSGAQLAQDAADADVVFLWERVDWLRAHWAGLFTDQLRRYRAGQPLLNVVDKKLGYLSRP